MLRKKIQKKQAFTLVEIMIAVGMIILLFALSIHGLLRARVTANETAAIKNLKTLHSAFTSYRIVNTAYPDTLDTLSKARPPYIDTALAAGTRQGYTFNIVDAQTNTFRLAATPISQGVTGNRSFYIDQGGEIVDETGTGLGGSVGDAGCQPGGCPGDEPPTAGTTPP